MKVNDRMRRFVMSRPVLNKRLKNERLATVCHCGDEIEIGDEVITKRSSGSYQYRFIYHLACAEVLNIV